METLKANELRIGNWVKFNKGENTGEILGMTFSVFSKNNKVAVSIEPPEDTGWMQTSLSDLEPIPLTEEWLVKLGFKVGDNIHTNSNFWFMPFKGAKRYFTYNLNSKMICLHDSYNLDLSNPTQTPCIQIPIKLECVHAFQNLVHALTGNELTIKS